MKRFLILLSLFGALASLTLFGCGPKGAPTEPAKPDPGASTQASPGETETEEAASPVALPLDSLPASLKNDAFAYYGLGRSEPSLFEYALNDQAPAEGSVTVKLIEVKDNEAKFLMERAGALAPLGNQELVLKSDGLYSTMLAGSPIEPMSIEMPSKITKGATWSTSGKFKLPTEVEAQQSTSLKVVGFEKVKVKAGEFQAAKVSGTGKLVSAGKTTTSTMTAWFAKDVGMLKLVIDAKDSEGSAARIRIELTR